MLRVPTQLRSGVSYRQLLAALFLAGIRNVNPRPPGFAMHCVHFVGSRIGHVERAFWPATSAFMPTFRRDS
jgi:hypothetical protein